MRITQIVIFVLLLVGGTFAVPGTATLSYDDGNGSWTESELSDVPAEALPAGNPPPPDTEILWNHEVAQGSIPRLVVIGYNDDYVWQGGWNSSVRLFEMAGDGTPLWEVNLGTNEHVSVAAAQTEDIFYAAMISSGVFNVYKFNHTSSTPDWIWDGAAAGYDGSRFDYPGRVACSSDGSVFAVGGDDGNSLAVMFFHDDSSTPFVIYEDETVPRGAEQVRLTADGSKCIFKSVSTFYRVDVATGTLEDTYEIGYVTDTFAISPDGSIVIVGFMNGKVLQWDGSEYVHLLDLRDQLQAGVAVAIAPDNDTVVFSWRSSEWLDIAISLYSLANGGTPTWTWESTGATGNQTDYPRWADISDDGEWFVVCSWGTQNNAHPEVLVFNSDSPDPWFTIDTPGSPFTVDISSDGQYICSGGKAVHANTTGSGGNVYAAHIDHNVAVESVDLYANAKDEGVLLSWSVVGDTPASVRVLRALTQNDTLTQNGSVDISGELSGSATSWL